MKGSTQVFLGGAVAIARRGVEVVDARLQCARDAAHLLAVVPTNHQAADSPTAEANGGDLDSGSTERSSLHSGESLRNAREHAFIRPAGTSGDAISRRWLLLCRGRAVHDLVRD